MGMRRLPKKERKKKPEEEEATAASPAGPGVAVSIRRGKSGLPAMVGAHDRYHQPQNLAFANPAANLRCPTYVPPSPPYVCAPAKHALRETVCPSREPHHPPLHVLVG